jgi:carbon monoxide dehydrogenase subunit G
VVELMPRREAKFSVGASPVEVWHFIRDFESLCTCVPGVERIDRVDDTTAELTVREKIGVVPRVMKLVAHIDSEQPPRRLHATARAEHLTMSIEVDLEASEAGTALRTAFDVTGLGPLKPVVDRLFEQRATERSAQFAECLGKQFGAVGAQVPAALPPRRGLVRRWLAALRSWLGAKVG